MDSPAIDPRSLADWLTVTLRWIFILAAMVVLAFSGGSTWILQGILLLFGAWNLVLTLLAGLRITFPYQGLIVGGMDYVFGLILFLVGGGFSGNYGWTGSLAVQTLAVTLGPQSGILAGLFAGLSQAGWGLVINSWPMALLLGSLYTMVFLFVGAVFGYVSRLMERDVRESYLEQVIVQDTDGREISVQDQMETILEITSALGSTLNYQRVLEIALDLSNMALGSPEKPPDRLVSAVLLFEEDGQLHVSSSRRLTPADQRVMLPGEEGLLGEIIRTGAAQGAVNPAQDPELSRIVAVRACSSIYAYPLRTGLDVYGVILFAHPEETFFTRERCDVLDLIRKHAVMAMQNARLYQDLEQEKERMMEVQEETRKKLARDLHDGPTQSVAAIAMRVNFARRLLERDPESAAEELFKIEELARETTKEIRHMLFTLRPLVLESQGLIGALQSMAVKMRETYGQNVIIEALPEVVAQLDGSRQGVVFYIAEEAVNNARKHAEAEHIWVRLKQTEPDVALLEIQDDGVGFNVDAVDASYENRGSLGMVNIRERAQLVNGVLNVESAKGEGTRIRVWIPLTDQAADRLHHRT